VCGKYLKCFDFRKHKKNNLLDRTVKLIQMKKLWVCAQALAFSAPSEWKSQSCQNKSPLPTLSGQTEKKSTDTNKKKIINS